MAHRVQSCLLSQRQLGVKVPSFFGLTAELCKGRIKVKPEAKKAKDCLAKLVAAINLGHRNHSNSVIRVMALVYFFLSLFTCYSHFFVLRCWHNREHCFVG